MGCTICSAREQTVRPDGAGHERPGEPTAGTPIAEAVGMTIADLQSMSRFEGWLMMPRIGSRLPLTPRERQILELVLGGRTTKEVAFELGLSSATVRVLYARAMKKLGRVRDTQKTDRG